MNLEQKARTFAEKLHKGQYRLDEVTPYITHPIRVTKRLKDLGITNQDVLCAAYLHDTIEDCDIDERLIEEEFNPNIARIVSSLTRDVNRKEYNERIRNSDYQVQIIKLADTLDNCEDLNPNLPTKTITKKVEDCQTLYLDLASKISPEFYEDLRRAISKYS